MEAAMTDRHPDVEPATFEAALEALGGLVTALESGNLGLSESIATYERGVALLRRLHDELEAVEERVRTLVRIDDDGHPVFADQETGAGEAEPVDSASAGNARVGRKAPKARSRRLPGMDDAGDAP
jgi:exodeoxyribonuclease VII small subunit